MDLRKLWLNYLRVMSTSSPAVPVTGPGTSKFDLRRKEISCIVREAFFCSPSHRKVSVGFQRNPCTVDQTNAFGGYVTL